MLIKDNKIKIDIVQKAIDTYTKKLETCKTENSKTKLTNCIEKEKKNLIQIKLKYAEELL